MFDATGEKMTISRRRFMQASAAMTAAGTSLGWALPALGKAQDMPVLMKEAEDLYARSIVVDMLADEVRDQEGLKFIKDSAVTCISTTLAS